MDDDIAVFGRDAVFAAISAGRAIDAVRDGFVRYAKGEWTMPAKVYLPSPPYGDFRAMPAAGGGIATLKWVTSFPGNPTRGLPVVMGTILVSETTTGRWVALVEGGAVTALRTGAAAAVATHALQPPKARTAGLIGCGMHGLWAGRCLRTIGFERGICADKDERAAARAAAELGWEQGSPADALDCEVVTLVTPGHEPIVASSDLHPRMHINALGADGPGKAEMEVDAVGRCVVFCDEWAQASHGGELTASVAMGELPRERVTEIGDVLAGLAEGRPTEESITLFDSTGLAIQDLAIVNALLEQHAAGAVEARRLSL